MFREVKGQKRGMGAQETSHLFPLPGHLPFRLVLLVPVLADTVSAPKAASLATMVTTAEESLDLSASQTSMLGSRRRLYGMCLEVVIGSCVKLVCRTSSPKWLS